MNSEEYIDLVKKLHTLITAEYEKIKDSKDLALFYPKMVIMYEFFRLMRGEAFIDVRPHTPDEQNNFYKMEDEIANILEEIKKNIDFNDERVKFYIEEAKKYF